MKKKSYREIEIIIQSQSQNLKWKVIGNIVGFKPETVICAYRREMQKRLLPPKKKVFMVKTTTVSNRLRSPNFRS
jgi:tRNA G37 N-methylase Trm5